MSQLPPDWEPPKRITGNLLPVELTGYLLLWDGSSPRLLGVPGAATDFVAVFSTPERLESMCAVYGFPTMLARIADGEAFLALALPHVRVMVDPHQHENGKLRWVEPFSEERGIPDPPEVK